jgi:hypothetical protein
VEEHAFRSLVDEVKRRTDLAALIGRDIELRPSGPHLVGSSPWNHDSTPSFVVWPDSQNWMDFSGGGSGGGDCIAYVQRRDGVDFMTALRALGEHAGVVVPNGSSKDAAEAARALIERRRVEDLLAVAATYYHRRLPDKIRREWLHERYGLTDETIDRWLVGWANGQLLEHLKDAAGATTAEALSTGLFVRLGRDRVVDLFRDRIVFPYWRQGRVCYFIARRTEHTADESYEQAKYKKLLTRSKKHPYFTTGRQLSGILSEIGGVVTEVNKGLVSAASKAPIPSSEAAPLFVRGGRLVRVDTSKGAPVVAQLEDAEAYGLIARLADWFSDAGGIPVATNPNPALSRDLLVYPPARLPLLEDVVATPVFGADGALIDEPGYHKAERLWLQRDPKLAVPPVPELPSDSAVASARMLLLDEVFGDFCFVDQADRAHALAALLLPFARRLIDGFTPLHLVEAPTPGTGKGLLCNLIAIVSTGRPCESRALPAVEEEIRKALTAALIRDQPIILLDNLPEKRSLDSSSLASLLTSDPWTDRLLGESRMLSLPNRALWLATGNNPTLSDELARRSIRIRLDTREEMPWKRTGFRHPNIRRSAQDLRGKLVQAALVLVQAWIAADRPLSRRQLGSFEEWVGVIGGVLDVAGVPGFLDNLDDLYSRSNAERSAWTQLVVAWAAAFGAEPKRVSELNEFCERHEIMTSLRGDGNERSQQSRLGRALATARDRVYAGWRVTLDEDQGRHKGRMYALVRSGTEEVAAAETGFGTPGTSGDTAGTSPPPCPPPEPVALQGEIDPWGT